MSDIDHNTSKIPNNTCTYYECTIYQITWLQMIGDGDDLECDRHREQLGTMYSK